MIKVIFKTKVDFSRSPNELIPVNSDYSLNNACAFGNLSKTNIFIGENNSGKSRFLRELFKNAFYSLTAQNVVKVIWEYKSQYYNDRFVHGNDFLAGFDHAYRELKKNGGYSNALSGFIRGLEKYVLNQKQQKNIIFPLSEGLKIIDRYLMRN